MLEIAFFDTHKFERSFFEKSPHKISFLETRLTEQTVELAKGSAVVCAFVNDRLTRNVLSILARNGTKMIALRSAGFNHVDLKAADDLSLVVARVPEYSPHAVAEHAVCLLLALNRKIHRAYSRVRESNFNLDGLVGFDLYGKTVGVVGTGRIGQVFAKIMRGFGCEVLLFDKQPRLECSNEIGARYVAFSELLSRSDIISLHVPLNPETKHLFNKEAFARMKSGAMLINTGRGALIDSQALISALKSGHLGAAGLDVYEEEEGVFFHDLSDQVLQDDTLARLLTFPNVLITSHQAFLTREALGNIADTTLRNIADFEKTGKVSQSNVVHAQTHLKGPGK